MNKTILILYGFIVALICTAWARADNAPNDGPMYSVLFISSYHPSFPTFFDQVEGLHSVLTSPLVNLDIEFMDSKRFNKRQLEGVFLANLQRKLQNLPPYDLIITGDDAATHFAVNHQASLFGNVPIVFFGVNDIPFAKRFSEVPNVTGVMEQVSFKETVNLMRHLLGDQQLVVVTDNTPTARADSKRFHEEMLTIKFSNYRILSLADYSFDELLLELAKIQPPSSLLLISFFQDRTGKVQDFDRTLMDVYKTINVPIFHLWKHGIGKGVLGGKLLSHNTQARYAAQLALKILTGTPPQQIHIQDPPTEFVIDYREMERFGFTVDDMPEDTQFINAPDPLYQRYQNYILASLAGLAVLSMLLIGLLIRMYLRRSYEKDILRINEELEAKVQKRTEALEKAREKVERVLRVRDSILDNSLVSIVLVKSRRVEWINDYAEIMFGYPENEWIGREPDFLYLHQEDYERVIREATPQLESNEKYLEEFAFRRKDGSVLWGMISGKALNPNNLDEGVLFILVDISARKQAERQLEAQATTDHLTGISNRRHGVNMVNREISKVNRYPQQGFSIIMIDVDYFKKLNDTYGHNTGDDVLKRIARILEQTCREVDTVARWGGEEFLVLCPMTQQAEAQKLAELLRERLEKGSFNLPEPVTASFGVAAFEHGDSLETLIQKADKALYVAKEHRNSVCTINDVES